MTYSFVCDKLEQIQQHYSAAVPFQFLFDIYYLWPGLIYVVSSPPSSISPVAALYKFHPFPSQQLLLRAGVKLKRESGFRDSTYNIPCICMSP